MCFRFFIAVLITFSCLSVDLVTPALAQTGVGEVTLLGDDELTIRSATKTEIPLSEAPGSVKVIPYRRIQESGARTIPELLRLVPGVDVRWNPMVQTIDIRGFGQNPFTSRVLLLIDGVPYNSWNKGGFPQHPGLDFFGLENVKQIEVLRGSGSALYGENAFWGVINIVTLSGADLEGGRIEGTYGDLDTETLRLSYGRSVGDDGSILVSAKTLRSRLPTVFWAEENESEVRARNLYVKGTYKSLELSYFHYEDELDGYSETIPIEVPGLPLPTFSSIDEVRQDVDIVALKLQHLFEQHKISVGGDLSYAKRDGSHCGACHAARQSPLFEDTDADHGDQLIADLRVGFHMLPSHDILVGVESRSLNSGGHADELGGRFGQRPILENDKIALYVQDRISLLDEKLSLVLGLRYDDSSDLFDSEVSPRAAAVYTPRDGMVWRAGWNRAFRFPNFSELYQATWFFNVDFGPFATPLVNFFPNPFLQPESIETFEAGWEGRLSDDAALKLDLYHSTIDDYIVTAIDRQFLAGGVSALTVENHPSGADVYGGELELTWDPSDRISLVSNYAYRDVDIDSQGVDSAGQDIEIVYAPKHKVNLGLYVGPFSGFRGSLEARWRDKRSTPSFWNIIRTQTDALGELPSDLVVDLKLSYELPIPVGRRASPLKISVYGKDLLDEAPEETVTGVDGHLVGRTFLASVEVGF